MNEWWNSAPLDQLDRGQWEALCDGCGKCCLHKLQDADSGELFFTRVRCRLLEDESCLCSDYPRRLERVPDCVALEPGRVDELDWLPATCAYRLRARGEALPEWHYLVSGSRESVHEAGISVRGRTLSEEFVHPDDYPELVVHWVD